jgi:predicted glycoside hydrolase/deacetylase ChbG (UPF0249 family)
MRLARRNRLSTFSLSRELEAQFGAFMKAFGRPPDFVDGHRHIHLFPQVRDCVLEVVRQFAPNAWVRQCASARPLSMNISDPKGWLVARLSREFGRRAAQAGIKTNPAFAGTYSYLNGVNFENVFSKFVRAMPEEGLVMCHPGIVDAELARLDSLTKLREREYAFFLSDRFPEVLRSNNVIL